MKSSDKKEIEKIEKDSSSEEQDKQGIIRWSPWQNFSNWVHKEQEEAILISVLLSFTVVVPIASLVAGIKGGPRKKINNLMGEISNVSIPQTDLIVLAENIDKLAKELNNESIIRYIQESIKSYSKKERLLLESQKEKDEHKARYDALRLYSYVLNSVKPIWARNNISMKEAQVIILTIDSYPKVKPFDFTKAAEAIPILNDIAYEKVSSSMIGSTYLRTDGTTPESTKVLDASLVCKSKNSKIIYGAIADGYGHAKDAEVNKKTARAALAAITTAVKLMAEKPTSITDINFIHEINDTVFKSFMDNEENRGQASLCYYESEFKKDGNIKITAVNIGDCMLVAYSPTTKEWLTIAPPIAKNPCIGGGYCKKNGEIINRSYSEKEVYTTTKLLPKDTIIIAMTDGVHNYLPWKKEQDENKSLDYERIDGELKKVLSVIKSSNNATKIILKGIRNLALKEQNKEMTEDKKVKKLRYNYGDDFTAHAVQPLALINNVVVDATQRTAK